MAKIPSARDRTPGTVQTPRIAPEQQASIAEQRAQAHTTRRTTVAALEDQLFEPVKVLDNGFIRVVDYMGDDEAIVQAARVSYGRGSKRQRRDRGLIRYLMRHWHTTPFEMCEIKLHVKLPIFVARQWIRHRTASVNEYSARYSVLDHEFYVPARDRLQAQSTLNSQGSGDVLDDDEAQRVLELLTTDAGQAYEHYEEMLNLDAEGAVLDSGRQGLARELARMNLSLNFYTQWYWKIDLLNLLHFVWLRSDPRHAHPARHTRSAFMPTPTSCSTSSAAGCRSPTTPSWTTASTPPRYLRPFKKWRHSIAVASAEFRGIGGFIATLRRRRGRLVSI